MEKKIIKVNNQNHSTPKDLLFTNSLNLIEMKRGLVEKFCQKNQKSPFQESISKKEFIGKQVREYIHEYGIEEKNLYIVYGKLEEKAKANGIDIEYVDISGFSEDEFYKNDFDDESHEKHAETARSDGKTLLLEKNINRAGGITGRMYDLLHLAFGHMVQWSTTDSRALLTKEQSWSIGYRNHEGSPDRILDLMALYEFEAGMMGVNALQTALSDIENISNREKESIIQYFTDYVYADSTFIIQHYRGNKNKFEQYFRPGQGVPSIYEPLVVPKYMERHAVEIGLIRDKQK